MNHPARLLGPLILFLITSKLAKLEKDMISTFTHPKLRVRDLGALLTNPKPKLDIEYKGWLDLSVEDDVVDFAKDILALANSGGGYIILGYRQGSGDWVPDVDQPKELREYHQVVIDKIVERYADVPLQCRCRFVRNTENQISYPIIVVPNHLSRPVFARNDGPDGQIKHLGYYIRRDGPVSAEPETTDEWEHLFIRCLTYARNYHAVSHWIKVYGKKLADEMEP
jgi:hypothetical protein